MLTLQQTKDLIRSRKSATAEVGKRNFQHLRDWSKSEDFRSFLSKEKIVEIANVKSTTERIRFVVGEDIAIEINLRK